MRDHELVNALRRLRVETGSLACMGCGHEHNCGVSECAVMREAADRIANQSTHIAALQQEIEKLRGQVGEPKDPEKMVAIVEQWAAEHPTKTRQSVFLELFPEAALAKNGVLTICPNTFSPVYKDERGRCKLPYAECDNCRRKFWLADSIPAADVAPVVHGRWEHLGGDEWCCSACGFVITTEGSWDKPTKKYCEDCGAKMDGGDGDPLDAIVIADTH